MREKIAELLKLGKTSTAIAAELGCSSGYVRTVGCEIREGKQFTKAPVREFTLDDLEKALLKRTPINMSLKKKPNLAGETLIVHLTDWHFGRRVTNGSGEVIFDLNIAKQRAVALCSRIIKLAKEHISMGTKLTEVALFVTGDMADGEGIYDGQAYDTDAHPPDQVMEFVHTIIDFVTNLNSILRVPVQIYAVRGNHGRSNVKGASPQTNWDTMAYKVIDFWCGVTKQKNIGITYSQNDYLNVDIQGHKYHLRHKGIPHLESSMGGKAVSWGSIHNADALVCGHLHHYGLSEHVGFKLFMGGSLMGFEDFAESLAKCSTAAQTIWGCTKAHMSTFIYFVDLN